MDYSKGGGQGTASCRSLTGLLQSPHFLCSNVFICEGLPVGSFLVSVCVSVMSRVDSCIVGDDDWLFFSNWNLY